MRRRRVRIELELPDLAPQQADRLVCLLDALSFDLYAAFGEHLLHLDGEGGFTDWLRGVVAEQKTRSPV
jgi:hypothetical protein